MTQNILSKKTTAALPGNTRRLLYVVNLLKRHLLYIVNGSFKRDFINTDLFKDVFCMFICFLEILCQVTDKM